MLCFSRIRIIVFAGKRAKYGHVTDLTAIAVNSYRQNKCGAIDFFFLFFFAMSQIWITNIYRRAAPSVTTSSLMRLHVFTGTSCVSADNFPADSP